jgi:phage protein D
MPSPSPRPSTGRLLQAFRALRQERDELAMTLAQIEAYQPGVAAKARAWVEQVDAAPRRRR